MCGSREPTIGYRAVKEGELCPYCENKYGTGGETGVCPMCERNYYSGYDRKNFADNLGVTSFDEMVHALTKLVSAVEDMERAAERFGDDHVGLRRAGREWMWLVLARLPKMSKTKADTQWLLDSLG